MPPDRHVVLRWLDVETGRLLDTVSAHADRDLAEDSTLPDWTLAHLLTHLARNAEALGNLLHWARTGIETPMYTSIEQRNADIAQGACRPRNEIIDDLQRTAAAFGDLTNKMSDHEWTQSVRTAQGRTITAEQVPWLRLREVAIHHVDLGAHIENLPHALTTELLIDAVNNRRSKPDWPAIAIHPTDSMTRLQGPPVPTADTPTVSGTTGELLKWITGRSPAADVASSQGVLMTLPPWL